MFIEYVTLVITCISLGFASFLLGQASQILKGK